MTVEITDEEVGKAVVTDEGQEIGSVAEVDDDRIYVDFTGGSDTEREEDISADEIKEITDDEVIIDEHAHA
ncbi:MAG: hypothetical protein IH933_16635 [Euryarchaeota archaeon]|nr:hypothetical protein [Euryarchaeota archaeon]